MQSIVKPCPPGKFVITQWFGLFQFSMLAWLDAHHGVCVSGITGVFPRGVLTCAVPVPSALSVR